MNKALELSEEDEYNHIANERADWRESYYFNWVDLGSGISGFSTIGLLPNAKKREFVFVLFYDGGREIHFNEPEGPFDDDLPVSLTDGVLKYELIAPLKQWRIIYSDKKLKADIIWPARFPAYDFGRGSGTSWAGHFEQSGSPYGTIKFSDGKTLQFAGFGERDKSWGSRDWHIDSWYALHAQFEKISIGLRRDIVDGKAHASGSITSVDGHVPIKTVDLETVFDHESGIPVGAKTRILGDDGSIYNLTSRLINPKSFVRFARNFPGGTTELFEGMAVHTSDEMEPCGTGLVEWLFTHPEKGE